MEYKYRSLEIKVLPITTAIQVLWSPRSTQTQKYERKCSVQQPGIENSSSSPRSVTLLIEPSPGNYFLLIVFECIFSTTFMLWKINKPFKRRVKSHLHLLSLLGAHHVFHVSGLRVKIPKPPVFQPDSCVANPSSRVPFYQFEIVFTWGRTRGNY